MKAIKTSMSFLLAVMTIASASACSVVKKADEDSDSPANDALYFSNQKVRESPAWVTDLEAAKDAEVNQLIVVAGADKTTAYVTMHERSQDGT